MKTINRTFMLLALLIAAAGSGNAQNLGDIFGALGGGKGNDGSNAITNILEGVFSSSNLKVEDLAGQWTSNGPAVTFQSENFLKKAGGIAAAGAVESKLAPYYNKYGLNGAKIEIQKDGTFTMTIKAIKLGGTITATSEKGIFEFHFTVLGRVPIGTFKTYVQKTSRTMDIMFDATKFKSLISTIAKYTGNTMAKTAASILDSYEGMCVGFRTEKTGDATTTAPTQDSNSTNKSNSDNTKSSQNGQNNGNQQNNGLEQLINIFGGKK